MAECHEMQKEEIYRIYTTDCLKIIAENIAKIGGGSNMKSRYYDIIQPVRNDVSDKTADEIIKNMQKKLEKMRSEDNGRQC